MPYEMPAMYLVLRRPRGRFRRGAEALAITIIVLDAHSCTSTVADMPSEKWHLPRILFADIGWVYDNQGVRADSTTGALGDLFVYRLPQTGGDQVPTQLFLGFLQRDRFIQRARDIAQCHILRCLDTEDHLFNEPELLFRKMGRTYPHKFLNLFSDFQRGLGSLRSPCCVLPNSSYDEPTWRPPPISLV